MMINARDDGCTFPKQCRCGVLGDGGQIEVGGSLGSKVQIYLDLVPRWHPASHVATRALQRFLRLA